MNSEPPSRNDVDSLDDPLPEPPSADGVLPLRAELIVDGGRYEGEPVSRNEAELASVDDGDEAVDDAFGDLEGDRVDDVLNNVHLSPKSSGVYEDIEDSEDDREIEIRKEEKLVAARLAEERAKEARRADAVRKQKVRIVYGFLVSNR